MMCFSVEMWATDKPQMIAALAIEAVSAADELAAVVANAAEGGRYGSVEGTVDLGQWIRFYRGHRRLQRFVLDNILGSPAELMAGGSLTDRKFDSA